MIDIGDVVLTITGIIAIITLFLNYNQIKSKNIIFYYEKTQEIRKESDLIDENDKDSIKKAKSLIKRILNFYDTISYCILKGVINEKDAFNVLKRNVFDAKNKFLKEPFGTKDVYVSLNKLYERWNKWGISLYYVRMFFYIILLLIVLISVIFLYIYFN